MSAPTLLPWTDANQRVLAAELRRLGALLERRDPGSAMAEIALCRLELSGQAAIDLLVKAFGLSVFERDVLLLAAGVEMDAGLASGCGEAAEQPQRPWATFGLALAALPEAHWSALTPVRPLRRWRLLEVDELAGLGTARLRIDERILHFLAGIDYLDARLQPLVRAVAPPGAMAESHRRLADEIAREVAATAGPPPLVLLEGDDDAGQEDVAAAACTTLGLTLHAMCASELPAGPQELDALATLWDRETILSGRALLVRQLDGPVLGTVRRFLDRAAGLTFVCGREVLPFGRPLLRWRVDRPSPREQRQLWRTLLGPASERLDGALDGMAGHYRLSARSIAAASAAMAPRLAAGDTPDARSWAAALRSTPRGLDALAQRIDPGAGWDDLVLPEAQRSTLREIATHVRHRIRVHEEWGFAARSSRGLGIGALFCGESGTGKTMAAEVLAAELALEMYRIDLSAVVSKYIGETEKNLARVFEAAEESGAILLFDEADALFGKRSEVKDSHDRYANIEVAYLLQRMEAYRGLAILTTNLRSSLDTAFQRRLRFIVHFPFPDEEQRQRIWRGILPEATPRQGLDFTKLARLHVAGGSIRNIALQAAFAAAEENAAVSMRHLLRAARADAAKRDRPLSDTETREWV